MSFLVLESGGDAIGNAAGRIGKFPGIKEEILRIVVADAVHHRGIEGIEAKNPVELASGEGAKLLLKFGIIGKLFRRQPGSRGK